MDIIDPALESDGYLDFRNTEALSPDEQVDKLHILITVILITVLSTLMAVGYRILLNGITEGNAAIWANACFLLTALLVLSFITARYTKHKTDISLTFFGILIIHFVPVLLWVLSSGSPIGDGTSHQVLIAHWTYAIPHLVVISLCTNGIRVMKKNRTQCD